MKIAIGSGKGGTGKTTVAMALALAATEPAQYLDCDVEEPNGHIFLKPVLKDKFPVALPVPCVDSTLCNGCGACDRICQFNAIISLHSTAMVFPELCHGCGGFSLVCPTGAISEVDYEIGCVETGQVGAVKFVQGCLTVDHAMSPPVIRTVRQAADSRLWAIIDCPPGTPCPFIASVKGADVAILVTEPTPFGLRDLTLTVDTVRQLDIPFDVIVNRVHELHNNVTVYCKAQGIAVLLQISALPIRHQRLPQNSHETKNDDPNILSEGWEIPSGVDKNSCLSSIAAFWLEADGQGLPPKHDLSEHCL